MSAPDTIRQKLSAIKRLAEQGSAGERDNAARLLEDLLKKYGLTDEDLLSANETEILVLKYSDEVEKTLAINCIGKVKNTSRVSY